MPVKRGAPAMLSFAPRTVALPGQLGHHDQNGLNDIYP